MKTSFTPPDPSRFETVMDGKLISLYRLEHENGMSAWISNYGSTLVAIQVPDGRGGGWDPVLGYDEIAQYINGRSYMGGLIGRTSNRIAFAKFSINGREAQLAVNGGKHQLHGGVNGFNGKVWTVLEQKKNRLRMEYVSPDGEEGYPGNCRVEILWELTDEQGVRFSTRAEADAATACHMGQHSYFNLSHGGDIREYTLETPAERYQEWFVQGSLLPVEGTSLDFRQPVRLGSAFQAGEPWFPMQGCDRYFHVRDAQTEDPVFTGRVRDPQSGRGVELWTTDCGFLFYSGHYLNGSEPLRDGQASTAYTAFCMEPEIPPNSINLNSRELVLLRPGEIRRQISEYRFFCFTET
jgi:aldose 1-epimerase